MLACFISILSFHAGPAVCHRNRAAAVRACAASEEEPGVRVNKALRATHSRREADRLVDEGRVSINGAIATSGDRLARGDVVHLDGSPVDWERLNPPTDAAASDAVDRRFVYLKYWKPRGIVCTTDRRQRDNILDAIGRVPGAAGGDPRGECFFASSLLLYIFTRSLPEHTLFMLVASLNKL